MKRSFIVISKEVKEAGCEWLVTKVFFDMGEVHYIWTDLDRKRRRSGAKHRLEKLSLR